MEATDLDHMTASAAFPIPEHERYFRGKDPEYFEKQRMDEQDVYGERTGRYVEWFTVSGEYHSRPPEEKRTAPPVLDF